MFESEISVLKTSFQKFLKQKISHFDGVQVPFNLKQIVSFKNVEHWTLTANNIPWAKWWDFILAMNCSRFTQKSIRKMAFCPELSWFAPWHNDFQHT